MRLGGRLRGAIDVLNDIDRFKRPAADALKDWGLAHRFAGAGDRAAIGNIVYDVLRRKLSLSWRMDSDDYGVISFGALLDCAGLTFDRLDELLEQDKFAPEKLAQPKRKAWLDRVLNTADDYIRADIPKWCQPAFENQFGSRWVEEGAALSARPPLDLRVNSLKSTPIKVVRDLAKLGLSEIEWSKQSLRLPPIAGLGRHPNIQAEPSFQKGWFEVQDLGSQLAALLSGAAPTMQVLDYCAGAGGKTLALAALMANSGQIYAFDSEKSRLAPIFARLRRAGVRNVQIHTHRDELRQLERQMDLVLVDAPCTGTGTWRRRPDAKWRLSEAQLQRRQSEQDDVLSKAARYVKVAGHIAYITCSVLASENDLRIANFLAKYPNFICHDLLGRWQALLSQAAPRPVQCRYGIVLSPASTDTDGFYVALLKKK